MRTRPCSRTRAASGSTRRTAVVLALLVLAPTAVAQTSPEEPDLGLDRSLLHGIYLQDGPVTSAVLHGVNATSDPVFMAAIPTAILATMTLSEQPRDWDPAFRLGLSQVSTTAIVYGLKYAVRRDRPFIAEGAISVRGHRDESRSPNLSFPSGHAALSFALATSTSLSFPEWYVIAPAMTWATLVTYSRPWLGVHYPSDVLAGAVIGSGTALLVHWLVPSINGSPEVHDLPPSGLPSIVIRF